MSDTSIALYSVGRCSQSQYGVLPCVVSDLLLSDLTSSLVVSSIKRESIAHQMLDELVEQ